MGSIEHVEFKTIDGLTLRGHVYHSGVRGEYYYDKKIMEKVLRKCIQDRASQSMGNPPFYVPMLNASGIDPAGLDFGYEREYAAEMVRRGIQVAPSHKN